MVSICARRMFLVLRNPHTSAHVSELPVVFRFKFVDSLSKFTMTARQLAKPNERSNDRYVDLDCAAAPENARQHRHALLCEDPRQLPATPM